MQHLVLESLKNYNLFINNENKFIKSAFINSLTEIQAFLEVPFLSSDSIFVFNHKKEQLNDLKIILSENNKQLIIVGDFKPHFNYIIEFKGETVYAFLNPEIDGIIDTVYFSPDNNFGISFNENIIQFKIWSPPAVDVELLIFDEKQNLLSLYQPLKLHSVSPGVWEIRIDSNSLNINLSEKSYYYQYKISAYGKEYIALDPYAKSMASFNSTTEDKIGKAAIIDFDKTKAFPPKFIKTYRNFKFIENESDLIAYEINVRDFTIQPGIINKKIAGTFKGLIEKIDYLKELGITHVQLMPVNKAYTQNEQNREYTGKEAKKSNYNWGYDPMNYFTLEGRYSTNPENPYTRIYEFKEMIQALHNAGIGVISDVVFNHTYIADTFENIAPGCYYRLNSDYKISGHTGAGASIESRRKQVRKFIIDVLKFYVQEYHIDGFRFDLMSFTDKETMSQIRNEVGYCYNKNNPNEPVLYGEAWNFTDLKENAFIKTDFPQLNIGIFNDSFRDAVAGNGHLKGFGQGNFEESSRLASAVTGGVKTFDSDDLPFNKNVFYNPYNLFAAEPSNCLNYVSVHDGLTLWDKINLTVKNPNKKTRLKMMKSAYAVLFTSQGRILLHGGDEILRTKPLADFDKEKHRAFTSSEIDKEEDSLFFHENSYCSNDYTNMFRWNRLTDGFSSTSKELLEYLKGLIRMRRHFSAFRINSASDLNNSIEFISETSSEKHVHSFKSYKLDALSIKFINGFPGEQYYLAGEIHPDNPNPKHNPYKICLNEAGEGEISFNKLQINNFDTNKWSDDRSLCIKLIKTPELWDFPDYAYTVFGNNSISPESLNQKFEVIIDLSKKDFSPVSNYSIEQNAYIAFKITHKNNQFIVFHNSSTKTLSLKIKALGKFKTWEVIVDNKFSGIKNITNTEVKIENDKIKIPGISTVVIKNK